MLKLTKYELIKTKITLVIAALIFAIIEGYFLYTVIINDAYHSGYAMGMMILFVICSFFVLYILAIVNYSKELSSKSSYLIFMTPNSALNIVLSKMLSILLIGLGVVASFVVFGMLDVYIVCERYSETATLLDFIEAFLEGMDVDTTLLLPTLVGYVLEFLINFFSIVTMIYLAITLSSTVLQNRRGKGIVSFILVVVFAFIMGKIETYLPELYPYPDNAAETVLNILPTAIFEFFVIVGCVFATAKLLEKKVSL